MNQLAKVYERLQRNYSECNMDYFGGRGKTAPA